MVPFEMKSNHFLRYALIVSQTLAWLSLINVYRNVAKATRVAAEHLRYYLQSGSLMRARRGKTIFNLWRVVESLRVLRISPWATAGAKTASWRLRRKLKGPWNRGLWLPDCPWQSSMPLCTQGLWAYDIYRLTLSASSRMTKKTGAMNQLSWMISTPTLSWH